MWPRIWRVLFAVYAAAIAVHVGWVAHHEPFGFDAWNVAQDTGAKPITVGRFFDYWWLEYTHSNPRFGQTFAYLGYKLEYFTAVATPLAFLLISLAVTVIGTRRWPWRKGRDLALWAVVMGCMWFALPQIGKTLFCRAYAANYLYALAIQLWFLVPLRFAPAPTRARNAIYFVFGVIAGMCNEHTGPTLCAFMVGYAWWQVREGKPAWFTAAGALGAVVGFAAIFFAPGQGERYDSLATRVSLVGRFLQRGFTGNVEIVRDLIIGVAPVLGLIAIVALVAIADREPENREKDARRAAVRLIAIAVIAALAMAATIFVSPKLGPRFYYGSACLLLAGFVALVDATLPNRQLVPLVMLSVAAEIYAAAHTVPMYGRLAKVGAARMAALEASKPGDVYYADAFEQVDEGWWFLGDDFRDQKKRELVATYFGLDGVVFHQYEPTAPLGVAGARWVPLVKTTPSACFDGNFAIGQARGFDIAALHHEVKLAASQTAKRLAANGQHLDELALSVELDDPRIVLPRKHVLVGLWTPEKYEGYTGAINRKGRSTTRDVALPKDLAGTDAEIYAYLVGGEAKKLGTATSGSLQYVPWKTGVYWILACRPDLCFVIAASKQGG